MKTISVVRQISMLGLVALTFLGCSSPTELSSQKTPPVGSGQTVLTIGSGTGPTAKTVLPVAPNIAGYVLSADSGSGFQTVATFSSLPTTASINQGTYDFKLEAKDSGGNVVLGQVQQGVVVAGESLTLNFTLSPVTGGPGNVLVNVSWPGGLPVASADSIFGPVGGAQATASLTLETNTVSFNQTAVASGNYLLTIRLKDSAGNLLSSVMEVVRVFQNLLSTKTINLAAADFNAPPAAPASVTAALNGAQVNVVWTDSSTNESGFSVERSANDGTNWTVLTGTPLLAGTTTFVDTAPSVVPTLLYRVKSINTFGSAAPTVSNTVTLPAVAYDGNGSTGGTVPASTPRLAGGTVNVQGNPGTLVRSGFALGGWNTASNGTGTSYGLSGASFIMGSANVTLFAVWIPTTLTFTSAGNEIAVTGPTSFTGALTIPAGVTTIRTRAFLFSAMTSAVIPSSVTSIELSAFAGCNQMTTITIGSGLANLGADNFCQCSALTSISIDASNPNLQSVGGIVVLNKSGTELITDAGGLTTLTVPASVVSIADKAFDGSKLQSITLPAGLKTIGSTAFGSSKLTSITLPSGLLTIGDLAFVASSLLTTVTIPASVTSIGVNPFRQIQTLTTIAVSASNPNYQSINGVLFNKAGTHLIGVPGAKAGSYVVPSGVTTIDTDAVAMTKLTGITLPSTVTAIGPDAFRGNPQLVSLNIPLGVTSIGDQAFINCGITAMTIPSSVTSIGSLAWSSCTALTSLTLQPTIPPSLGVAAFPDTPATLQVHVPAASLSAYRSAPNWSGVASQIVSP